MQVLLSFFILICAYVLGSIPFGLIIVQLSTGKDVRQIASGRTGGTNAFRAAGFWAGFGTAIFDIFKGAASAWLGKWFFPENPWYHILLPVAAILGHNYSIFLIKKNEKGAINFGGGAGGAPCLGGALGLWAPSILFIFPISGFILYFLGYASLTTLSVGILSIVIFTIRAWANESPWQYVLYGMISEAILIWALRPNIQRLIEGNERLVGWRARKHMLMNNNKQGEVQK